MPSETFVKAEVRPNRLVVLRDWVAGGGGLAMIGGYLSFQGIEGKANYRSTALAEVLPVELEPGDDRQEAPDGAVGRVAAAEHPITVLATIGEWPLLVVGRFGEGRVLAFASDIGPHWAPRSFTEWPGYTRLWSQAITWLACG